MKLEGMDNNSPENDVYDDNFATDASKAAQYNVTVLAELNEAMFRKLAPAVAVLLFVMVVGIVGNLAICYIFIRKLRKSTQNFLLLCLGVFDLLSSCVGVPAEIFDIGHYFWYPSVDMCKAMRFLTTFPSLASILVLLVIAADRYRKVCKPLYRQIHLFHARIIIVVIIIIALLFSVPAVYIYGHRTFRSPIRGVFGYDCSVADKYVGGTYPLIYEGIFLAAFILCTISLVSIYVRIWLETSRHRQYLRTHATYGNSFLDDTTTTSSANYDSSMEDYADSSDQRRSARSGASKSSRRKQFMKHLHRKHRRSKSKGRSGSDFSERFEKGENRRSLYSSDEGNVKANDVSGSHKCMWQIGDKGDDTEQDIYDSENLNIPESYPNMVKETGTEANAQKSNTKANCNGPCPISSEDMEHQRVCSQHASEDMQLGKGTLASQAKQGNAGSVSSRKDNNEPTESNSHLDVTERTESNSDSTSAQVDEGLKQLKRADQYETNNAGQSVTQSNDSDDEGNVFKYSDEHINATAEQDRKTSDSSPEAQQCPGVEGENISSHSHVRTCNEVSKDHSTDVQDKDSTKEQYVSKGSGNREGIAINTEECETLLHSPNHNNNNVSTLIENKKETTSKQPNETQGEIIPMNRISFYIRSDEDLESNGNIEGFQSHRFSSSSVIRNNQSTRPLVHTKSSQSLTVKRMRKALKATRTTIIACTITAGFILSYLPHLILIILRSVKTDFEHHLDDAPLVFYNIFIRSYFVNNVINIFVYGTMNLEFRKEISRGWSNVRKPFAKE